MDALLTLALLAVLLAGPCFVQLVLWTLYAAVRASGLAGGQPHGAVTAP